MGEGYWRQLCEDIVQTIEDPTVMDASLWMLYLQPLSEILELNSAGGFARIVHEPDPDDGSDSEDTSYSEESVDSEDSHYSDDSVGLDDGSDSDDADDSEDAGEADELDASSDSDNYPDSFDRLDGLDNVDHSHNPESSDDETDSDSDSSSRSYDTNNSIGRNHESRNLLQHLIFTLPDHLPLTKQSAYKSLMTWSHTLKTKYHSCPLHKNTDIIAGSRLDGFRRRIEVAHEALFRRLTGRQLGDTICVDASEGRTAEAVEEARRKTQYQRSRRREAEFMRRDRREAQAADHDPTSKKHLRNHHSCDCISLPPLARLLARDIEEEEEEEEEAADFEFTPDMFALVPDDTASRT
ncbi:MAG: hypothetical protein L6R37_007940 [Teloschistes peruensis]|nr:MAG: hypothetical protein L6R37_007940 [Teloschistes peruensis]